MKLKVIRSTKNYIVIELPKVFFGHKIKEGEVLIIKKIETIK